MLISDGNELLNRILMSKKCNYKCFQFSVHTSAEYFLLRDYFGHYFNGRTGVHFMNTAEEVLFILNSGIE